MHPLDAAGNRVCADDIAEMLSAAGIDARIAGNVMPEFNVLDVEPARAAIRDVFIERIVHAKGIDKAEARFDAVLMPTPAAVMEGARLLADGNDNHPGWGPLMVVDVGGATTDVHSIASGAPADGSVVQYGLPEPYAKRTVEGDLGMRHNARTIVETAGADAFAGIGRGSESSLGREQPFQALVPGHRTAQQSAPGRQDRCLDEIHQCARRRPARGHRARLCASTSAALLLRQKPRRAAVISITG